MKRGSVLMETVIAMPILLLLIFGVIQFAHIWTARQMTAYAAYCATRAVMIVPPDEQKSAAQNAAEVALSWMNLADSKNDDVTIPGWGRINGAGTSDHGRRRTSVTVLEDGTDDDFQVSSVQVKFKFPLLIPAMAINKIIARAAVSGASLAKGTGDFYGDLDSSAGNPDLIDGWPYIELTETCVLPMPYSTARFPNDAFKNVNIRSGGGS